MVSITRRCENRASSTHTNTNTARDKIIKLKQSIAAAAHVGAKFRELFESQQGDFWQDMVHRGIITSECKREKEGEIAKFEPIEFCVTRL